MGRTKNSGLTASKDSPQRKDLANKANELSQAKQPFNSSKFDYESSNKKYETYLLDLNHVDGCSKAKFLKDTLGYSQGDGKILHENLANALNGKNPYNVEKTQYGIVARFKIKLKGNNGIYEFANVTAALQLDNGKENWRIITIFPDKKTTED